MEWSLLRVVVPVIFLAVLCVAAETRELTLAQGGTTDYAIVLGRDATEVEKSAAGELAVYLERVTGAAFEVTVEPGSPGSKRILVGPSRAARRALPGVGWGSLGTEGIVIHTVGDDLVLGGGRPRGTLYAAYEFLERFAGCRWWAAGESTIPRKPTLRVPQTRLTYVPSFKYRESFYFDVNSHPEFARYLKVNGQHNVIGPKFGGHFSLIGWCHTFYKFLPPEKYFARHPEWYSQLGGQRKVEGGQLCLTNEDMRKEMVRVALDLIRKDPEAGIISISQNDWHGACECARCSALAEKEGGQSGPLIHFVNAVAEEIEKEFPDVLVETLAYQYTRKPPKNVKPRDNVVVRLCSIECSFAHPLDSDINASFRDDIRGWRDIARNLYIWNYVTDFAGYIQPHPNMRNLGKDLRFFQKSNVMGVFQQGDYHCSVGDFVRLRAWVIAHLLWDPSLDQRSLEDEFLAGYYGAAAPYLRQYLDLVHEAWDRRGEPLRCYNRDLGFLTLDDLNKGMALFAGAAEAVEGDGVLPERVRRERLPLDHVWILRHSQLKEIADAQNKEFAGPADGKAAVQEFIQLARRWNALHYTEGQSFASYEPTLRAMFRPPAPPPDDLDDLLAQGAMDVQQEQFQLYEPPKWVEVVDDVDASDGRAARMGGGHTQWAVQYHIPWSGERTYVVYVIAKCDARAASGAAIQMGIYDGPGRNSVLTNAVSIQDAGKGYRTYDLGEHSLKQGHYIWVAPAGNAEGVDGVSVDRIIFRPAESDG